MVAVASLAGLCAILYHNVVAHSTTSLSQAPRQHCLPSVEQFPDPNLDPFYTVSASIVNYCPGQVIRSRPVLTSVSGLAVNSYQLFYATTNEQGNTSGTVATVWEPARPAYPQRVFSYQFAEGP